MLLEILYVVGFIACIVVYIMAAQQMVQIMDQPPDNQEAAREQVVQWLDGKSTDYNLAATLSFALEGIGKVLNEDANDLIVQLDGTVNGLRQSLRVSQPLLRLIFFIISLISFRIKFSVF